jgi:hypothetical protein
MKHDARVHLLAFVSSFSLVAASGCTGDDTAGRETAGSGGSAGAAAAGGQTAAGAGSSAAGSGGAGSSGSSGASAGSGGAGAGAAGSAGRAGGGGASGAGTGGTSGMNAAGTSGATAGGGAAGAAGSGGRTYSTDRATFFGASRCAAAGVLLCDDFESGTIDAATWKNYQTAPKIDALQAARGTKALHVTTAATGGSGLRTTKIFPRTDGLYYGRMFIYFTALPTGPNYAHWTVIGSNAASDSTDKSELRVGGQLETINKFGVGTDHGPTGDWTNLDKDKPSGASSVREVPKNEWICLEWMVDTANELTKFWWDGTEHPSLATTRDVSRYNSNGTKYVLPDISSVWVGFENYNQGGTMLPANYDVWIDEVALDPQRIGCSL